MRRILALICAFCLTLTCANVSGMAQTEQGRRLPPVWDAGFELDVLTGGGGRLEELHSRGRIYVEAIEGEEYELRVRNPLPVRVAVALSVDGLNTIDARRSSSWDASKWVLEPYQSIRVTGWQMSTARARKFYFTSERESYAARLGRASDLGLITAVFYREATHAPQPVTPRPYPMPEPRSERRGETPEREADAAGETSRKQRGGSASVMRAPRDDDYAATGIGRSVENHVRWVNLNLERRPAAEVSIRYEYRPALVRLGVLPRPHADENALRRRERARGFEDPRFCPEP